VRQIKRAIFIDMKSIRFLDMNLRAKFEKIPLLADYIKMVEKAGESSGSGGKEEPFYNFSQLTNLGLFRYYAEGYLKSHPLIDKANTTMVRHRAPEGNGLPVQVFTYTANNSFVPFEHIQSEIFEHLLAILREFDLKVYQQPTGEDILELTRTTKTR